MSNIDRYLIIALFGAYVSKLMIQGASLSDAAIVLVLASANFLVGYFPRSKELSELKQELIEIKKLQTQQNQIVDEIKTSVASVKISQGLRNVK